MTAAQTQSLNAKLYALFSVNFIGALGFSIVMPFLVFLVNDFGGNSVIYGIVGATYSFFQLIGAPVLGGYSDRVGRRKALFISQAGTTLAWIIVLLAIMAPKISLFEIDSTELGQFTLTIPLLLLFVGRALDGITGGNISVANAYLVDLSTDENQSENFGKMATSSNLGFILGPVIAGTLGATVYKEVIPTAVAALIAIVGLALIYFYLPESKSIQSFDEAPCKNPNRKLLGKENKDCFDAKFCKNRTRDILKLSCVPVMLLLYFLIFLAFNIFYSSFPIHASSALGWEVTSLGLYFSFLAGLMIVVQGPILKKLSKKFSSIALALTGNVFMIFCFFFLTSHNLILVMLSALFFALGNGVMWPSFMTILSRIGSKDQQGALQGVSTSAGSLASIVGLILGGVLYSQLGTYTFAIAGVVFLITLALMSYIKLNRNVNCA